MVAHSMHSVTCKGHSAGKFLLIIPKDHRRSLNKAAWMSFLLTFVITQAWMSDVTHR